MFEDENMNLNEQQSEVQQNVVIEDIPQVDNQENNINEEYHQNQESAIVVSEPIAQVPVQSEVYQNAPSQDLFHSEFANKMDEVKTAVLAEATQNDDKFVNVIKTNIKDAAIKHTEVEQSRADYTKQQITYESEKLTTLQQKNENQAKEDTWSNREKRRQYHYNGLKPIMESISIKDPMNLIFLYIIAVIITPIFIAGKILRATFGALIAGASDGDRSKAARGFLWTMLCITVVLVLSITLILFLKSQDIDILAKLKQLLSTTA